MMPTSRDREGLEIESEQLDRVNPLERTMEQGNNEEWGPRAAAEERESSCSPHRIARFGSNGSDMGAQL